MLDLNTKETSFAINAVRAAATLVRRVQSELVSATLTKDDRSPVTVADYASQALVAHLLHQMFPNDPLVAEEDSSRLRTPENRPILDKVTRFVAHFSPQVNSSLVCEWIDRGNATTSTRFWTLDPIDGTKGFLRGDQYAVALALIVGGEVQIGVLGCPSLSNASQPDMEGSGSLVVAVRGQGTWTQPLFASGNFSRLHVSRRADPAQARMLRSFESAHTNTNQIDEFAKVLRTQTKPVLMDSQAKYAVLAAGQGDLLLRLLSPSKPDYREKIWDQAAGSIVVQEAGGQVSDLHGNLLDFSTGRTLAHNRGVLASNGHLHSTALSTLASIGA